MRTTYLKHLRNKEKHKETGGQSKQQTCHPRKEINRI